MLLQAPQDACSLPMPTVALDQETKERIKNAPVAGISYDEKVRSLLSLVEEQNE